MYLFFLDIDHEQVHTTVCLLGCFPGYKWSWKTKIHFELKNIKKSYGFSSDNMERTAISIRTVLKMAIKYRIKFLTTLSGYARINKKKCQIISVKKINQN